MRRCCPVPVLKPIHAKRVGLKKSWSPDILFQTRMDQTCARQTLRLCVGRGFLRSTHLYTAQIRRDVDAGIQINAAPHANIVRC